MSFACYCLSNISQLCIILGKVIEHPVTKCVVLIPLTSRSLDLKPRPTNPQGVPVQLSQPSVGEYVIRPLLNHNARCLWHSDPRCVWPCFINLILGNLLREVYLFFFKFGSVYQWLTLHTSTRGAKLLQIRKTHGSQALALPPGAQEGRKATYTQIHSEGPC